jgi:hypothetical protein
VTALDDLRAQGHSVTIRVQDLPAETASVIGSLSPRIRCSRNEIVIFPVTMQLQAQVLRTLLDDDVAVISVIPEADALEQFYLQAVQEGNQYMDGNKPDDELATQKLEALIHGDER